MRGINIDDLPLKYRRQAELQLARKGSLPGKTPNVEPSIKSEPLAEEKDCFPDQCVMAGFQKPAKEYKFHPSRKWKIDYAWPKRKIALEIEGGIWMQGRHTRGAGFLKDIEKYNELAIAGWRLVRTTPKQISDLSIFNLLKRIIEIWKEK